MAPSIGTQHPDWVPFIKKGAAEWNAIGSTMQFAYAGVAPDEGDCGTAAGLGIVRHRFIPPENGDFFPAHAWFCYVGERPVSFVMELNTAARWYAGALDPGANEFDVWAVASHEFGHVTGWGAAHYDAAPDAGVLCDEGSQQKHTMCPSIATSNQRMRTLEAHDIGTFNNAYPVPTPDPICSIDPTAASTTENETRPLDLNICY